MNNPPRSQFDNEKEIERTKPKVDDGQEVACPDIFGMILQEDRPCSRGGFGRADLGDVFLNRVLGDGKTQFEQFATNAFGNPQAVLQCHPPDQGNGSRGQFGTTTAVTRFELPEEAESLARLAEEGVGLKDERRLLPVLDATGEEDKPEAIGLRKGGLFDLTVKNDQLLPKQRILGDEIGFAAGEVSGGAENNRVARRLSEMEESLFERRERADE